MNKDATGQVAPELNLDAVRHTLVFEVRMMLQPSLQILAHHLMQ